jgi:tripartite-type tricarboxylate transporter receptor subunit TctC
MPDQLRLTRRHSLALLLAAVLATRARAAPSALKHLSLLSGTQGGSNLDAACRAFAEVARAAVPGLVVDVESQPSALAVRLCVEAAGRSDFLCFMPGGTIYTYLAGVSDQDGANLHSLTLVGALGADRRALFVSTRTGITNVPSLLARRDELIVPTATANAISHTETLLVRGMTGIPLRPVAGYSNAERKLALMSGEASAVLGSVDTFQDLVDQGQLLPLLRLNDAGPSAPFAELPTLRQVAKGGEADTICDLIDAVAATNTLVVGPPALTDDQVAVLVDLFSTVAPGLLARKDPGLRPTDLVPSDRATLRARFDRLFAQRTELSTAINHVLACARAGERNCVAAG